MGRVCEAGSEGRRCLDVAEPPELLGQEETQKRLALTTLSPHPHLLALLRAEKDTKPRAVKRTKIFKFDYITTKHF